MMVVRGLSHGPVRGRLSVAQTGVSGCPAGGATLEQGALAVFPGCFDEALSRVGLSGLGPRRPAQLSGGQASRAALARALLRARPILLLDEPFAALGPALRSEMLELVREVADETGALTLMVTHAPEDALALGGDTAFVAEGIVHPPVPTHDLLAQPTPAVQAYLGRK